MITVVVMSNEVLLNPLLAELGENQYIKITHRVNIFAFSHAEPVYVSQGSDWRSFTFTEDCFSSSLIMEKVAELATLMGFGSLKKEQTKQNTSSVINSIGAAISQSATFFATPQNKMIKCRNCGGEIKSKSGFWTQIFDRAICPRCCNNWNKHLFSATSKHYSPKNRIIPGERTIGWELECNPTPETVFYMWRHELCSFVEDGSLRGSNPVEMVTPVLSESTWKPYAERFFRNLKARIYQRAGLHLWIGTADLSWMHLLALWTFIHRNRVYFYAMCPPCRIPIAGTRNDGGPRELPECPPLHKCCKKSSLLKILYGDTDLRANKAYHKSRMQCSKRCNDKEVMYEGGCLHRYQWVNLHGHFFRRAIEIRIHSATTSLEKFMGWANLWMSIVDRCAKSDPVKFSRMNLHEAIPESSSRFVRMRIARLKASHISNKTIPEGVYKELK